MEQEARLAEEQETAAPQHGEPSPPADGDKDPHTQGHTHDRYMSASPSFNSLPSDKSGVADDENSPPDENEDQYHIWRIPDDKEADQQDNGELDYNYDDEDEAQAAHRSRINSAEFHQFMSRRESVAPLNIRRSELPTYYRPFYTGDWYKDLRTHCYPHGWTAQVWTLLLTFLAQVFTIWGAFSCQYFRGANVGFTGGRYGLWTLEDIHGKCQLWSVLFYSLDLGSPLRFARVFSMCAMVLGLAVLTTMAQAMQCHAISYGVGFILFLVFLVSVSTTSTFNIWIVWALFNYFLFVIIVRAAFVHPVARRISKRGTHYIAACQYLCHVFSLLTLVVLKSDFCTCDSLTPGELEGRIDEHIDPCEGVCALSVSGYMVIFASALWLASSVATLRCGVQPDRLCVARPPEQFAFYSRNSITTRARNFRKSVMSPFSGSSPRKHTATSDSKSTFVNSDETGQSIRDSHDEDDIADSAHTFKNNNNTTRTVTFTGNDDIISRSPASPISAGSSSSFPMENDDDKIEEEHGRRRTHCQACCCDYRIAPRSRNEKVLFWSFRCTLGFIFTLYVFLVILMIGQRVENLNAQEAPSTSPYFITDVVCAFDPNDTSKPFRTFENRVLAHADGYQVAHCGECGFCSNMADIQTYVETRKTIADSAKSCGPVSFLGSFGDLVECLQEKINFSEECTVCWAENMINTGTECLFTCVHTLFTGFMASNNVDGAGDTGWMNHCLYCDEKLSGPGFVTCSGVARRRLGIVSEIERNPAEQCKWVDIDWVQQDFAKLRNDQEL